MGDLRNAFATPNLPFTVASSGMSGRGTVVKLTLIVALTLSLHPNPNPPRVE